MQLECAPTAKIYQNFVEDFVCGVLMYASYKPAAFSTTGTVTQP